MIKKQKSLAINREPGPEKRLLDKKISEKLQSCLRILSPKEKTVFLHQKFLLSSLTLKNAPDANRNTRYMFYAHRKHRSSLTEREK